MLSVDSDLIVAVVHVAQLHPGVGLDLHRLVVGPEVGDVDGEAVGADRRDGPDPGLRAVDGGQEREAGGPHRLGGEVHDVLRVDRLGRRSGHGDDLRVPGGSPSVPIVELRLVRAGGQLFAPHERSRYDSEDPGPSRSLNSMQKRRQQATQLTLLNR